MQRTTQPLVGRRSELDALEELLTEVLAGQPRTVLLAGEAGIGKSRLLQEVIARGEASGMVTLAGACVDLGDGAPAFGPLSEALRRFVRSRPRAEVPDLLGPSRRELTSLVPALSEGDMPPSAVGEPRQVFAAVADTLAHLAAPRGALFAVEDLHWADPSTLELVSYLARTLRGDPVLVIATYRTDEIHRRHPLRPVLGELSRIPTVVRLELEPLDRSHISELGARLLGRDLEPDLLDDLAERSGGNPFYVEELLAAGTMPTTFPDELQDALTAHLADLPDETRRVLAVVATLRRRATSPLLELVLDMDRSALTESLRTAVEHHVLTAGDDGSFAFRHALLAEAMSSELLPAERTELHRRVAEALEQHPELAGGGAEAAPAELAHHWYAIHEVDRALAASLDAASWAEEAAAFAEALTHLDRCLTLWGQMTGERPPKLELHLRASDAARRTGATRRALRHLEEALALADRPDAELAVHWRAARCRSALGDEEGAIADSERAHALAELTAPSVDAVRALITAAAMKRIVLESDPSEGISANRKAVDAARAVGDPTLEVEALDALAWNLLWVGEVDEATRHLEETLALSLRLGNRSAIAKGYGSLIFAHYAFSRSERCHTVAEEAWGWLGENATSYDYPIELLVQIGYTGLRSGRWDRVEEVVRQLSSHHLEGFASGLLFHLRGLLRWMQGRFEEAQADVDRFRALERDHRRWYHDLLPLEAEVAAELGDLDRVRSAAATYLSTEVEPGEEAMKVAVLRPLVRAEVDAARGPKGIDPGHAAEARRAVEQARELLASTPADRMVTIQIEHPRTMLALAEAELTRLEEPDPEMWESAADQMLEPYWRLYARLGASEAWAEAGNPRKATQLARGVHDEASRLGAAGLARRAAGLVGDPAPTPEGPPAGPSRIGSGFQVIVFTDIVGSTDLTSKLGDARMMELLRHHDRAVRSGLARWGGVEIKHTGDGIMATFGTVSSALSFAGDVQRSVTGREGSGTDSLQIRIGIAAGEPIVEGDDLFGAVVQLAARLCDTAGPGEVLVASTVKELAMGKGHVFHPCERIELKGFSDPACPYRLEWSA